MASPGQELSSINFESMLGGPLVAVVNAQAQSAMTSVNFIKSVGFKPGEDGDAGDSTTGEPIYVSFTYDKEVAPYQPAVTKEDGTVTDAVPAKYEKHELKVPILTMLPIPFIRIDTTTIDFNAKINSVSYMKTNETVGVDGELTAKAGWGWGSARLKVSASYKKNTQQGNDVNRTYSLAVHIKAVQDEMPAGLERILGILEDSISSKPAT